MAEDDDLIVSVGTFVGREGAAEHRRGAQGRKETRHDELRDQLLRPAVAGEVDPGVVETGHRRERRFPLLPPAVVERGDDVLAAGTLRVLLPDRHETGRFLEGQTLDEHGVDDREDRRVRADAQGERRDRDGGEAGVLAERAGREAEVLPGPLEERQAAAIPHRLLRDVEPAELPDRFAPRLLRRHSAAHGVVDVHLDVGLELLRQVPLLASPPEESGEPGEEPAHAPHARPSAGARKRARMAVVRSHSRVSSSTWRRPARVSL